MGQRFGNVALFVIEVGKQDNKVFASKYYANVEKFDTFKKKHGVSEKMMNLAYEYGMLYNQNLIETPLELIHKVSMKEADSKIIFIQGKKKMSTLKEVNTSNLSVQIVDDELIMSGEVIKNSPAVINFIKANNANWNKNSGVWENIDVKIYDDNVDIKKLKNDLNEVIKNPTMKEYSELKKDADKIQDQINNARATLFYGDILTINKNEKVFNEAKTLYYEAKKANNDDKTIEARNYIYNISNIVLYGAFSKDSRLKQLQKAESSFSEKLPAIAKLEKSFLELENNTNKTEEQVQEMNNLEKELTSLAKEKAGIEKRKIHLNNLSKDMQMLKDMGYLKPLSEENDTLVISSREHTNILYNQVKEQNENNSPDAKSIDNNLSKQAKEIKTHQDNNRTDNQNQNKQESTNKRRNR